VADDNRAQIRAIIQGLREVTEQVVVRLSLNVTAELIETTPVDTGWARANWVPAIGVSPIGRATSDPDAGQVAAQQARQALGQAQVLSYQLGQGSVFISNNVPYIGRLNDGSSSQAPTGFIQAAIRRGVQRTEADLR